MCWSIDSCMFGGWGWFCLGNIKSVQQNIFPLCEIFGKLVILLLKPNSKYFSCQRAYNIGHNILASYCVSVEVWLATSKTRLDIYYSKLNIRVASGDAKRLKTYDFRNLGHDRKSPTWLRKCPVPSILPQKSNFGNSGQKLHKSRYQSFLVLSNFAWSIYFLPNICPGL